MLAAAGRDGFQLFGEPRDVLLRDAEMVAGVVADLEAVAVQLRDLLPREVVALVGAEREALGDEKRGAETQSLEQRPRDRVMGGGGVVEGEDDQTFRERFRGRGRRRARC